MYIKQIRLQDFQSHVDSKFDLSPNLSTIIGVSNVGKSSLSRALSFLLFGAPWDKSWVRYGAKYCKITLETDTGIIVLREKGDKVNKYTLIIPNQKEEIFEAFGTGVPEPIKKALNIYKVVVGNEDKINLNFSSQHSPLFMLNSTDSSNARILGTLSGGHYIDWAIREINRDTGEISRERSLKEKELEELKKQVENSSKIEQFKPILDEIEAEVASVNSLEARLNALQGLFERMKAWKAVWLKETDKESILEQISTNLITDLEVQVGKYSKISLLLSRIVQFKYTYEQKSKQKEHLDTFNLSKLPEREQIEGIKRLKDISSKLKLVTSSISNLSTCLQNTEIEHTSILKQYSNMLTQAGVCPTCNQKICEDVQCA